MSKNPKSNLRSDQAGLVSFMVVTIIMIVLTLIIMAFARIVNREQIQTLDRQLNSQAFYAAESGVNDALDALSNTPALASGTYNNCNDFIDDAGLNSDLGNGVSYSCLLVDTSPSELDFPNVDTSSSTATRIRAAGSTQITSLQISWEDASNRTTVTGCPAVGAFPITMPANCQIGMLRFELVPFFVQGQGNPSRDQLITNRSIGFLQPRPSGYTASQTAAATNGDRQGLPIGADCRGAGPGPRRCTFTLTGLNMVEGFLRMKSIYSATPVTIRAFNGSTQLDLVGSQVEIDVTGKANDVLKRIKVSAQIPTAGEGDIAPEFALQTSKTQCKRFEIRPGVAAPSWLPGTDFGYCNPLE